MTISHSAAPDVTIASADPAWDEAFLRVESYIRAHGLESRVLLNQITAEIIREARAAALTTGAGEPVTLALQGTQARMGVWFARTGRKLDWTDERMQTQARLALILADLPGRWADYFLSPAHMPADLAAALATYELLPGPELHLSTMAPAPLEFGFVESDDPRLPSLSIWLPIRAIVSWLAIFSFFGIGWATSH